MKSNPSSSKSLSESISESKENPFPKELYDKYNDTIFLASFNNSKIDISMQKNEKFSEKNSPTKIMMISQNPNLRNMHNTKAKFLKKNMDPLIESLNLKKRVLDPLPNSIKKKSFSISNLKSTKIKVLPLTNQGSIQTVDNHLLPPVLKHDKSPSIKLSKLKSSSCKALSKSNLNPYSAEWNQNTMKNHFNLQMKINTQYSNAKILVTKLVKKPVKYKK